LRSHEFHFFGLHLHRWLVFDDFSVDFAQLGVASAHFNRPLFAAAAFDELLELKAGQAGSRAPLRLCGRVVALRHCAQGDQSGMLGVPTSLRGRKNGVTPRGGRFVAVVQHGRDRRGRARANIVSNALQ